MELKLDGKQNPKFRLMLLGSKKVGKTSLINQMVNNYFNPDYYPTKDLIIYKKLYNFNPKSGEFDDFCYIELIDTMAYDRSKNLKDFSEFFAVHLSKERDISKTNTQTKIPENILKSIKHEYLSSKDTASAKGLFSTDNIMSYIFVFDYQDDNSLHEMIDLYSGIATNESIKVADENLRTVKCFICNKYPVIMEEVPPNVTYSEAVGTYMDMDRRTFDIVTKIQKRLSINAKEFIFFTSTKSNLGVSNSFNSILNKIKHKEYLWKKITYEIKQDEDKNVEKEEDDANTGIFCCKKKKVELDKKHLDDMSIRNQSNQEKMNFKDEDEGLNYDNNIRIKPKGSEEEEEGKSSMCLIY